jgi:outer membrane lipoprotein carrier protein
MEKTMSRKVFYVVMIFLLSGVCPPALKAQPLPLEEILTKVQELYDRHEDFEASFVQVSLLKSLGKKQVAEGEVYFKKPGRMRWDYQKPVKQVIVSDGKNLWNYRPEDKQVVVSPMTNAFQGKVPSTFLAGIGNLKLDFQSRWAKEPSPGENYFLELTPRETQGSLEKLFLQIDRKSFEILQAKIQDVMGNVTEINFSQIHFDKYLSDSLFTFTPPQGVEVFHLPGASPAGQSGK